MGQSCKDVGADMTPTIVLLLFAFIHQGIPCINRRLPQITYHPVDGGVIAAQEEAYRQEMIEKYEAELSKQETSTEASEDESNSTATCRVCSADEEDSPRFFFNVLEDERQLPCCTDDDDNDNEDQEEEATE